MAQERVQEASWGLVESTETGTVYVEECIDGTPVRRWKYSDLSPAAKNMLEQMIHAFDYGYDIRFQFPSVQNGQKVIVPARKPMGDRGDGRRSSIFDRKAGTAVSYFGDDDEDMSDLPDGDEDMTDYLQAYIDEKNL